MSLEIRAMTMADYAAIHGLWSRTAGMGLNSLDDTGQGVAKYLDRNPSTCFVAVVENEVIGVVLCGHDGRRGYLYHLAVAEERRGQGVGGALLDAALAALEAEGIIKAALVVFSRNELGNRFWERHGFTPREDLVYRNRVLREYRRLDTKADWHLQERGDKCYNDDKSN